MMNKLHAALSIFLVFILCACGSEELAEAPTETSTEAILEETTPENRLRGYYKDQQDEDIYLFEINEYGGGEYGGEVKSTRYKDGWAAWYIENNIVYINGEASYGYVDDYLFDLDYHEEEVTIRENGTLSGSTIHLFIGGKFDDIYFMSDKTCSVYTSQIKDCYYKVENNIVKIYDESDALVFVGVISDGMFYSNVLLPV